MTTCDKSEAAEILSRDGITAVDFDVPQGESARYYARGEWHDTPFVSICCTLQMVAAWLRQEGADSVEVEDVAEHCDE